MLHYIKKLCLALLFILPLTALAEPSPELVKDTVTVEEQPPSNFKNFITCKDESLSLSNSLATATAKSKSFETTVTKVIQKLAECQKLGDIVKEEAASARNGADVAEATNISQERMKIEQKILIYIRDHARLNNRASKETGTQDDKNFAALQIANSYVKQAEDVAWTRISIRHNDSKVDSISFYNFFSLIFLVYFVIFIFNRNIKKKKL